METETIGAIVLIAASVGFLAVIAMCFFLFSKHM